MVVLFFTSPIGLGHATRDIAICEKLRSLTNDKILFVTGSAAYTIISNKGYVAYDVYTPNNFQVNYSMHLQSMIKWLIQYVSYYKRCKIIDFSLKMCHLLAQPMVEIPGALRGYGLEKPGN